MAEIAPQKAWGVVSRGDNGRWFLWSATYSTKRAAKAEAKRFPRGDSRPVRVLIAVAEDVTLG